MLTTSSPQAELLDWSCAKRGLFYQPLKRQLTLRLDADMSWLGSRTRQRSMREIRHASIERCTSTASPGHPVR
jgi:hypothetical protein